jgi:hypothetical protein
VVSISTTRAIPSALGFAQGIFAGAGAAAGKGAGAACGAAAPLVAGVCDHAVPDAHSETTPAKIKPAAMRIVFPLMLIASGPRLSPSPERFPAPADTSLVGPAPPRQRLLLPAVIFLVEGVNSGGDPRVRSPQAPARWRSRLAYPMARWSPGTPRRCSRRARPDICESSSVEHRSAVPPRPIGRTDARSDL